MQWLLLVPRHNLVRFTAASRVMPPLEWWNLKVAIQLMRHRFKLQAGMAGASSQWFARKLSSETVIIETWHW